jgi:hypothetical protein
MHPVVFKVLDGGFKEPYIRPKDVDSIIMKDLEWYGIADPPFVVIQTPDSYICSDVTTLTHRTSQLIRWSELSNFTENMINFFPNEMGRFYSETYVVGQYDGLWDM